MPWRFVKPFTRNRHSFKMFKRVTKFYLLYLLWLQTFWYFRQLHHQCRQKRIQVHGTSDAGKAALCCSHINYNTVLLNGVKEVKGYYRSDTKMSIVCGTLLFSLDSNSYYMRVYMFKYQFCIIFFLASSIGTYSIV